MSTVLIAVDGTEHDQHLLAEAQRLFGRETDFFALNVRRPSGLADAPIVNFPPVAYGYTFPVAATALPPDAETRSVYRATARSEADGPTSVDEARHRAAATAESAGVDAEPVGDVGEPADAIVAAAARHDADAIVIGNKHRGFLSRLLRAPVTDDVVESSPVPVLVISTPD